MVNDSFFFHPLEEQIFALELLKKKLAACHSIEEKNAILSQEALIQAYLESNHWIKSFLNISSPTEEFAIKSLIAIGQAPTVFFLPHDESTDASRLNLETAVQDDKVMQDFELESFLMGGDHSQKVKEPFIRSDYGSKDCINVSSSNAVSRLKDLLQILLDLEQCYSEQGGVIGYHQTILKLIVSHEQDGNNDANMNYYKPSGLDLTKDTEEIREAIFWGIQSMPLISEIYPVGGSADRLDLHEDSTGTPLPAAMLHFEGRTLLEGLIRDVQAREYLYYKLYHKQTIVPIAMMTSEEKLNYTYIVNLLEKHHYFNRPTEKFFFFLQPLVPVVTKKGNWSMTAPQQPTLKPGGHGVIWKVAQDRGVFDWLAKDQRTAALVRQINNPIAGTDHTLLALSGLGYQGKKAFGFLSCDRLLNSAEGVNILKESRRGGGYDYCISNIEYTDMKLKGIKEIPLTPGSAYSQYPSNTNVLFANLAAVQAAVAKCPIPGQLINMKTKVPYIDPQGNIAYVEGGRLESLMQNIADHLTDHISHQINSDEIASLKTFIAYNDRKKTISTTKKLYQQNESPLSTPEYALYDRLSNNWELMSTQCDFTMPPMPSIDNYLSDGPSFIVLFHPALGPLYAVISQKIRKGSLAQGSEMQLEIAEFNCENLTLDGSLLIHADQVMGASDKNGILQYGEATGKCTLRNVTVTNRGINKESGQCYWKNEINRDEALDIRLSGDAEFVAEDVIFQGDHQIYVPSGYRWTAYQENGRLAFRKEKLVAPTWSWSYSFTDDHKIVLLKRSTKGHPSQLAS
jgi:UTP---glucose-1-phosphate uridylyltransferase